MTLSIDTNEPINKRSFSPPSDRLLSTTSSFADAYYINSPPPSVQSVQSDLDHSWESASDPLDNDQLEQSYNFNNYLTLPIAHSQDYNETFSFSDEIEQVLLTGSVGADTNNNCAMPLPIEAIKIEFDVDAEKVLRYDSMIDGSGRTPVEYAESQELIPMVTDIETDAANTAAINQRNGEHGLRKTEEGNLIGSILVEHNYSPIKCNQTHNTSEINMDQNEEAQSAPRSVEVTGKVALARQMARRQQLPRLKIQPKWTPQTAKITPNVVSTPDITNDILDMETENERFDLIKFLDPKVVSIKIR